jgi:hypothetical protein
MDKGLIVTHNRRRRQSAGSAQQNHLVSYEGRALPAQYPTGKISGWWSCNSWRMKDNRFPQTPHRGIRESRRRLAGDLVTSGDPAIGDSLSIGFSQGD